MVSNVLREGWSIRHLWLLVGVLVLVIVVLLVAWPHPANSVVIRVTDGPTVLSTQVVPLR